MGIVSQPKARAVRHYCAPPRKNLYPWGTVWECDTCKQRWIRNYGLYSAMSLHGQEGWGQTWFVIGARVFWSLLVLVPVILIIGLLVATSQH